MATHLRHLRGLTVITAVLETAVMMFVFFYAPLDGNQPFKRELAQWWALVKDRQRHGVHAWPNRQAGLNDHLLREAEPVS
ncbi:MAG: hypothetical protein ACP5H2_07285 [Solirubrobacteraceae bacterium]